MPTSEPAGGADPSALRDRARALLDLGRIEDALEAAQRALIADPTDPDTEVLVARCHAALDQPHDAIRHASRASTLAPEWPLPHILRARILVSIGHRDEAERAADAAIALAPDLALAHSTRGIVLAAAERRPDDAWASARHAVELAPEDPDVRVDASRVALSLRNWAAAEEHAQAALAQRPDDDTAMNLLGAALSQQGRPADALAHFVGAARAAPSGVGADLARHAARHVAGTADLDVRRVWIVLLSTLAGLWTLALLPRSLTLPVFGLACVAVAVWWTTSRRNRRASFDSLSDDERRLVERARTDPGPGLVAALWTVFGVAVLIGGLYLLQIVAPPADGATTSSTWSAVIASIAAGVAAACWWRLRTFRALPEE